MLGAMSTFDKPICHKWSSFRRSNKGTVFSGDFHIQNQILGYLLFPCTHLCPGEKENGLETSLSSSRSYQSLSCRFRTSDWFNVNALEDLKEIRETYSRG